MPARTALFADCVSALRAVNATGGATSQTYAQGIAVFDSVDVLDNTIADVNSLADPCGMSVASNYGGGN